MSSSNATRFRWYKVWLLVVLNPGTLAFKKICSQANKRRCYDWYFIGSLAIALSMNVSYSFQEAFARTLLIALGYTSVLIIITALLNAIARILGGTGNYRQHCFAFASFVAPIGLVAGTLNLVFRQEALLILPALYAFYLYTVSTRAVHELSWIRAFVAVSAVFISLLLLVASFSHLYIAFIVLQRYFLLQVI